LWRPKNDYDTQKVKAATNEILIKNGFVYDPASGINGDVKDIAIQNGKIVEASKLTTGARVIDARGKSVLAGGVDIHTHVAGPKVNVGRLYRPEDKLHDPAMQASTKLLRAGGGFSVPSTFTTAYRYALLGYTMVNEAAMPPLLARHTHEEIRDTPIIDQSAFTLLGNNWLVMEYIKRGETEKLDAFVAWMLKATKGSVVKLVNPGGTEAWGWVRIVFRSMTRCLISTLLRGILSWGLLVRTSGLGCLIVFICMLTIWGIRVILVLR